MSKVLSSIGVVHSVVTTSSETRPTTGYIKIPQIFENSETDLEPGTIDTTSYNNLKYMSSIPSLIDTTGIQTLTANATAGEDAETVWDNAVTDYESGKYVWLCIDIPGKSDCTFIPIVPIRTGSYNISLNDKVSIILKFTIAGDFVFASRPTYSGETTYAVTVTGYVANDVELEVYKNNFLVNTATTEATSTIFNLTDGAYSIIARKATKTTQIKDVTVDGAIATVTFSSMA